MFKVPSTSFWRAVAIDPSQHVVTWAIQKLDTADQAELDRFLKAVAKYPWLRVVRCTTHWSPDYNQDGLLLRMIPQTVEEIIQNRRPT